ncbi:hypothetical protein Bca52824_095854 [Brassica carinata]|uniref:Uncharacterized protein n=1 Tax=Brassica carinata TaxID=52824 RepID=A0A8X7P0M1_BRACI|nr:hypothetical protein Bca52824_095854 [Brassica carinata]
MLVLTFSLKTLTCMYIYDIFLELVIYDVWVDEDEKIGYDGIASNPKVSEVRSLGRRGVEEAKRHGGETYYLDDTGFQISISLAKIPFVDDGGDEMSTVSRVYAERGLTELRFVSGWITTPFLQLDSIKNRVSRGCASFSCFSCGGASAGLDTTTPCPLKVEPVKQPVVSTSPPESVAVPENGKDHHDANKAVDDDNATSKEAFKLSLRSSLKRPPSVAEPRSLEDIKEHETLSVDDASDLTGGDDTGRRKVQWPDACGSELTQVREFEPSEMGLSDEEWETGEQRTCSCVIM